MRFIRGGWMKKIFMKYRKFFIVVIISGLLFANVIYIYISKTKDIPPSKADKSVTTGSLSLAKDGLKEDLEQIRLSKFEDKKRVRELSQTEFQAKVKQEQELKAKAATEIQARTAVEAQSKNVVKTQTTSTADNKPGTTLNNEQISSTPLGNGVQYLTDVEDEVVRLCNIERQKYGVPNLVMNDALRNVAKFKVNEMLTKNYFAHQSPYTGSSFDLMDAKGYKYTSTAGENIQTSEGNPKSNITAKMLVTNWMNSPGHKANIIKKEFTKMGVGVAWSDAGLKAYESQMFSD